MKKLVAFVLLGMCCFVLTTQAWAEEVTRQLPFSKKVKLVVPKTYLFMFELCADNACADVTYAETQTIVLKTTTLSFNLGAGTVDPTSPAFSDVDFSQQYWLRISRSSAKGFVAIGLPSKLSVVPYALWSNSLSPANISAGTAGISVTGTAANVTGTVAVANGGTGVIALTADKVMVGNGTYGVRTPTSLHWDNVNGRVGVGTSFPAYSLDVNGSARVSGTLYTGLQIVKVSTTLNATTPCPWGGTCYYNSTTWNVSCHAGTYVIGGGSGAYMLGCMSASNMPYLNGWTSTFQCSTNNGGGNAVDIWAICARIQ